ncbi:hypothetical protein ACTXT7_004496 [Hymenolepis weldensis]
MIFELAEVIVDCYAKRSALMLRIPSEPRFFDWVKLRINEERQGKWQLLQSDDREQDTGTIAIEIQNCPTPHWTGAFTDEHGARDRASRLAGSLETGSVNLSGPINSTSLSPNLSSIEEDGGESQEGPQQHLFNIDSGESPDETQHKAEFVHSGSRTNRVFPHGEEAIPSFPSAPTHQNPQPTAAVTFSPLTKLHLSPEIQEEGNLEENSLTTP